MTIPNITLCWTDIETTGLEHHKDMVIEIAYQFTDYVGEPLTEVASYNVICDREMQRQLYERMQLANPYVAVMHTVNGLWTESLHQDPDVRRSLTEVIELMVARADAYKAAGSEVRIAGSSVHFDKNWLEAEYGESLPAFSHRVHDLSTIRPFMQSQGIDIESFGPEKTDIHRAADDVERDIAQWNAMMKHLETS